MPRIPMLASFALTVLSGCALDPVEGSERAEALTASTDPDDCDRQELLQNGDFDATPRGAFWTEDARKPVIRPDGVSALSSPNAAWLAGYNFSTDAVYQDVTVPEDTTYLVVSGQLQIRKAGLFSGPDAKDEASVQVTQNGFLLHEALRIDARTLLTEWTTFSATFPGHAEETIRIHLAAGTDNLKPTSFFFDSLSVLAIRCDAPR